MGADFMLKAQRGYRGIEFGLEEFGPRKWAWTIYRAKGPGIRQRGEIVGTRDAAVADCRKAIDTLLDCRPPVQGVAAQ